MRKFYQQIQWRSLLLAIVMLPGLAFGNLSKPVISKDLENLFFASLDFYSKLQRTHNGLYLDNYAIERDANGEPVFNDVVSSAAIGVGLIGLCMDHELGRDPGAELKALETLRTLNGRRDGFKPPREKAGYFRHFFSTNDGSGHSEYSTIDTAIMVVGALFCRNYFDSSEIRKEADQLWNSIDWQAALADPDGKRLYMMFEDGTSVENSKTQMFNEYYLLAWLIEQHQIQSKGASQILSVDQLPYWEDRDLKLLSTHPGEAQSSFIIQFPFYMCHSFTKCDLYRDYVAAQAEADRRACEEMIGESGYWGCGAGRTPRNGYLASNYKMNPDNVVAPHIIAGFLPVLPEAQDDLLKFYRDETKLVETKVGKLLPRFSADIPDWKPRRIEAIDYSSMIFGLAAIHPKLGMDFFSKGTEFTFNRTKTPAILSQIAN